MEASEIHARRLNAKDVITTKMVENPRSRSQMEQINGQGTRFSGNPRCEECKDDLRGESDVSHPKDLRMTVNLATILVDRRESHLSSSR